MIYLKSRDEIEIMRQNGSILKACLETASKMATPGTSKRSIDEAIEKLIVDNGAKPAFKGFQGYPASTCISVNDEVVHGMPDDRVLEAGDICGVDVGVLKDGYYADGARTFAVGDVSADAEKLLEVTREALEKGIEQARPGNRLTDISHAVETYAKQAGFSVVRTLVGHGIGQRMHEEPQVPNFGPPKQGPELEEGMVLAIEPMLNVGQADVFTKDDGWTIVTADHSLSAHFEDTVAITSEGPEILTR